jgi:hypothetical protein
MIDYAILCQAIDNWRSGRRPSLPPSSTPTVPAAQGASMEEVDSDMLEVDEYGESAVPQGYESPEHTPVAPLDLGTPGAYSDDDEQEPPREY